MDTRRIAIYNVNGNYVGDICNEQPVMGRFLVIAFMRQSRASEMWLNIEYNDVGNELFVVCKKGQINILKSKNFFQPLEGKYAYVRAAKNSRERYFKSL